jgi:hypothetical protein
VPINKNRKNNETPDKSICDRMGFEAVFFKRTE